MLVPRVLLALGLAGFLSYLSVQETLTVWDSKSLAYADERFPLQAMMTSARIQLLSLVTEGYSNRICLLTPGLFRELADDLETVELATSYT